MAAAMAFREFNGQCRVVPSLEFTAYMLPHLVGSRALVVGVTASGDTSRVVDALACARALGAHTIAITGNAQGAVGDVTQELIVFALADKEPCPATRSWQASLLALYLLAVRLGEIRGTPMDTGALVGELMGLAPALLDRPSGLERDLRMIADIVSRAPGSVVVGSGPNAGTARFCAAKFVEAIGRLAIGTDIEEWWHVERHLTGPDLPLFVLASPGPSRNRAFEIIAAAKPGWRVIAVADPTDDAIAAHAEWVLPVKSVTREAFSPILWHTFAPSIAAHAAEALGVPLFPGRAGASGVKQ
jgi:glucosamine--fructose-6-phosphate aminotransferase (isomerizing)